MSGTHFSPEAAVDVQKHLIWFLVSAVNLNTPDIRMPSSGILRRVALARTTRSNIRDDGILHSHRCENLNYYTWKSLADITCV
jgi:hypothetical protein